MSFVDLFLISISLSVTETATKSVIPMTTNAPHQMPLLMQLYTSPDYRSPLDPNTKVQSDKRIYAEVRNNLHSWRFFRSPDICPTLEDNWVDFGSDPLLLTSVGVTKYQTSLIFTT